MTDMRQTAGWDRPYLLLTLAQLFWAGNIVLGRFVAGHVPPVALSFIRWGGAFLIVLPFAWPRLKQEWPVIRSHSRLLTILTLTGISAYNTLAYWSLQYTQAIMILEVSTGYTLTLDPLSLATLVYVAIFPSVLGYLFFNRGVELIGPNRAAPFFHLIPVFGSALAILFLGEEPRLYHAVGYALVLAGITIATRK